MKPLILALDASGITVTAAVLGDTLLAERIRHTGLTHSETLMPMLQGVLEDAGCTLRDIDAVATAVGPGSFTGLRIGISTAKALAHGAGKPLIPVGTLPALALQGRHFHGLIAPVMDARRAQVYAGVFESIQPNHEDINDIASFGLFTPVLPCKALAAAELAAFLEQTGKPVLFCGDGVPPNRAVWESVPKSHFAPAESSLQRATHVAAIAQYRWLFSDNPARDVTFDPLRTDAVYLRASQAEQARR